MAELTTCARLQVLQADIDLLHPPAELEKRSHKLKRLVQSPNSFFMDVKCQGCFQMCVPHPPLLSMACAWGFLLMRAGRVISARWVGAYPVGAIEGLGGQPGARVVQGTAGRFRAHLWPHATTAMSVGARRWLARA